MENPQKISMWAQDERPREKLMEKGKQALSDSELLAILINSGTKRKTAVDIAKEILSSVNSDLIALSRLSLQELMGFEGIGQARAIAIMAALELGNRKRSREALQRHNFTSSDQVSEYFMSSLSDLQHEEFHVLFLNRANKLIKHMNVSRGGTTGTVVDVKIIMKEALMNLACSIIVCHNHPSGNTKPSPQDIAITRKIKNAAALFNINVLDHLIVGENKYFSFADEGMLN